MLKFTVIPIATLRPLELRHKWLMQIFVSFAGFDGLCWPSLRQLAVECDQPLSWVQRNVEEILALGYVIRVPRKGGGYTYTVDKRFLPVRGRPVAVPTVGTAAVPTVGTGTGAKIAKEGVPAVDTGSVPTVRPAVPTVGTEVYLEEDITPLTPLTARRSRRAMRQALAPDDQDQRRAENWVRDDFWLPNGTWGPRPDQPGCTLPPDLLAWCLAEKAKRSALVARVASAHSGRQEESLHARREAAAGTGTGLPTRERLHALRGI
jgi:hypothetical protein